MLTNFYQTLRRKVIIRFKPDYFASSFRVWRLFLAASHAANYGAIINKIVLYCDWNLHVYNNIWRLKRFHDSNKVNYMHWSSLNVELIILLSDPSQPIRQQYQDRTCSRGFVKRRLWNIRFSTCFVLCWSFLFTPRYVHYNVACLFCIYRAIIARYNV